MSEHDATRSYTKEHEWAKKEGDLIRVGITDYAQSELGDVVFVDLPKVGDVVTKGASMLNVESVKAVSDIYAPVAGEIVEVNEALRDSPELVNQSPLEDAWMVVIKPSEVEEFRSLMDRDAYEEFLSEVKK